MTKGFARETVIQHVEEIALKCRNEEKVQIADLPGMSYTAVNMLLLIK